MRLAIAVVAVLGTVGSSLSSGYRQPAPQPTSSGTLPDVTVQLVIASENDHKAACTEGKYNPVDVLIIKGQPQPWSCVDRVFFAHDEQHPLHCKTVVVLGNTSKNQVIWQSSAEFRIEAIGIEEGKGPANPFLSFPVASVMATQHKTGPIVDDAVDTRYKVTFFIDGMKVDPDIQCRKI